MTSTLRHCLIAFALATAATGFGAMPAMAQKQGGTLTVGLELDVPGFDPLKVGVYDTAANIAAKPAMMPINQAVPEIPSSISS